MADFTLSSGSFCRPYRSPWGAFPIRQGLLSTGVSSLAINLGQVVISDTRASTCEHRVKASILNSDFMIWGIAAETASGGSAIKDTKIPIWEANPMVEFKAATLGGTLVSSHVGSARSIVWDSTLKIALVDLGASSATDNRVLVTELIDAVGDSGGYVAFRFMQTDRSSTNNSSVNFLALYGR